MNGVLGKCEFEQGGILYSNNLNHEYYVVNLHSLYIFLYMSIGGCVIFIIHHFNDL